MVDSNDGTDNADTDDAGKVYIRICAFIIVIYGCKYVL